MPSAAPSRRPRTAPPGDATPCACPSCWSRAGCPTSSPPRPSSTRSPAAIATASTKIKNTGNHSGFVDQYAWGEWDANEHLGITDIRATGVQSLAGIPGLAPADRLPVFAVNMYGRWSTPSDLDVEVEYDVNGDATTDFILVGFDSGALFAGAFDGAVLSFLFDADGNLVDLWPAVAPTNGSTYLLATAASSLGLTSGASSFDYDTFVYSTFLDIPSDDASNTGHFDVLTPALSTGAFTLLARGASVTVPLTVDTAKVATDPALGWLIASNDDANGARQADLIPIGTLPTP